MEDARTTASDTWTFVLVTPDGVLGDALGRIIVCLRGHGLRPAACCLVELSIETMREIYLEDSWHIDNPGYDDVDFSWDMHRELYELAPAYLIMLSRPDGGACEAMLRCKGNTRPEIALPGTIRWSTENVIFNFVHSPDDIRCAKRELALLVGPAALDSFISAARSETPDIDGLVGIDALNGCVPAFTGWAAVSYVAIANKIRRRIVQWLALATHRDGRCLGILSTTQRLLTAEAQSFATAATSARRLDLAVRGNPIIHSHIAAVAGSCGSDTIIDGVNALDELYRLDGPRRVDAVLAMSGVGIYLSPLEKVIIESHSYSFRPGRELMALYANQGS